jgi:adenosine deaminase
MFRQFAMLGLAAVFVGGCVHQQPQTPPIDALFEDLRTDAAALAQFMRAFPKGGDIHHHLIGAPTPQMLMEVGAQQGYCLEPESLAVAPGPCAAPARHMGAVTDDEDTRERLVDLWSMRGFGRGDPRAPDHFFGIFPKIWPVVTDRGELLARLKQQAASENLLYLETQLQAPEATDAMRELALSVAPTEDVIALRELLRATPQFEAIVERGLALLAGYSETAARRLGCASAAPDAGCGVEHRYQIYALRILPTPLVLADMILAYELAQRSPEVVGVNVVGFEGDPSALANYAIHMRALGALSGVYPDVKLALHAGEITAREADAQALRTHVPDAFYVAGARRIGHGNAIVQSQSRDTLLEDFAFAATAVEVSLTSNELLLGLAGDAHHIKLVWEAGVPLTLNTDDAGIFVTDLSREYALAAARYRWLSYVDFKTLSRQSLESAFVEGPSLWRGTAPWQPVEACANIDALRCLDYVAASPRARLQRDLENRFVAFERRMAAGEL